MEDFEPHNDLERRLVAAQQGDIPGDTFMAELLEAQVFMPVQEDPQLAGIQTSDKANPLTMEDAGGNTVLLLFTSSDRAESVVRHMPEYVGGRLAEFKWVLDQVGFGVGIALNPGWEVGFDLDPASVEELIRSRTAGQGSTTQP